MSFGEIISPEELLETSLSNVSIPKRDEKKLRKQEEKQAKLEKELKSFVETRFSRYVDQIWKKLKDEKYIVSVKKQLKNAAQKGLRAKSIHLINMYYPDLYCGDRYSNEICSKVFEKYFPKNARFRRDIEEFDSDGKHYSFHTVKHAVSSDGNKWHTITIGLLLLNSPVVAQIKDYLITQGITVTFIPSSDEHSGFFLDYTAVGLNFYW